MENNILTTRTARIWLEQNGIVHNITLSGAEITLAEAQENVKAVTKVAQGIKRPLLVDTRQVKSLTYEARKHLAGEGSKPTSAIAILVDSLISQVIGNFFINFSKPNVPTRLFANKAEATEWLKGFLHERNG